MDVIYESLIYICMCLMLSVIVITLLLLWVKLTTTVCISKKRLEGKTAIVTGGTSGMGLEIAKDLARRGARVIVACPFEQEGIRAEKLIREISGNGNVFFKFLDLSSLASTRIFVEDFLQTEDRLDILINNAGLWKPHRITPDGMDFTMQVNYYGHFLLTILMLPILRKSGKPGDPARVVNVSSIFHWIGRRKVVDYNNASWLYGNYSDSKLSLAMFAKELTKKIINLNVVVNTVDPGVVATEFHDRTFGKLLGGFIRIALYYVSKTPWQGSRTALHVALDTKAGKVSGCFFVNCKIAQVNNVVNNENITGELFENSMRLVKLSKEELKHCLNE